MKLALVKGATSVRLYLFIQNSSVTTGAGLTGLVFNSASLTAYYVRPGGSATAITLATQTVTGAYSSGGFVEVDATNMPGVYRFDVPDAVLATGVDSAVVMLKGATNMAPVVLEIQLTGADLNDATSLGLSRLDATVSSRLASASYTAPLDAAGTRSAVGLAVANLDTQLGAIDDFLDTEIAAIKAKTDSLTFTVAGVVDANVQRINDVTITGNGQVGTEFGV